MRSRVKGQQGALWSTVTANLLIPALWQIARITPQDPVQRLGGQPASEPSPRVLLGSRDECLTETVVHPSAAVVIGLGRLPL